MKKRLASLFLALALCLGLCLPALAFTDVPGDHYAYAAIMNCSEKGITSGYSDGSFRPGKTVTRANFAVMLAQAFYPTELERYSTESNLKYGYAAPAFVALNYKGLLAGTNFDMTAKFINASIVNAGINRYDMAQLMTNIMKDKGFATSDSQKSAVQAEISDYSSIPGQYQDAVKNVYALGMIGGYADGAFHGEGVMNRGQAAAVIYRMMQLCGNAPVTETPGTGGPGTPEPPAQLTGRTLANGQPITEENVTAILDQLQAKYPSGTRFVPGYAALGSGRNPSSNCIDQVVKNYSAADYISVNTVSGCGGWAALVADEIFGQLGVTWKKTTIKNARPGDLMIDLDTSGYLTHVHIYVSESTDGFPKTQEVYQTGASDSSGVYHISWGNSNGHVDYGDAYGGHQGGCGIWTAYPD